MNVTPEFVRQLAGFVPSYAADVLYCGPHRDEFAHVLRERPHVVVHSDPLAAVDGFDCVVDFMPDGSDPIRGRRKNETRSGGCWMLVGLPGGDAPALDALGDRLASNGFVLYRHHALSTAERPESWDGYIAFVVHGSYNPMLHARDLMRAGHADWAFDVLMQIPDALLGDPTVCARVAAEKMVCLLAWDKQAGEKDRLARFFYSQATFYDAVAVSPTAREVYLCQGEFWKRIGDSSMRRRLLRSVFHTASVDKQHSIDLSIGHAVGPEQGEFVPPEWNAQGKPHRVLFVTHPRPHYGLDVLYDGLCEVLGDAQVVEFPYKPTLHGAPPEELGHYPCSFNRAGTAYTLDAITRQLQNAEFDLVIYGDIEQYLDEKSACAIACAAGNMPMVLVDEQDDPLDQWAKMNTYVGVQFRMYFKREMLKCWDYGARTVPLPFAYSDRRVPNCGSTPRNTALFWAGHRKFGLRRLYLEHIESRFGLDLTKSFSQQAYAAALSDARIGLNIFGLGYDTVRYWEIPAHGAMLLAERLPIHVPHDFVDGVSAVFFDDLPELEEKLAYYLVHPDEAAAIAARGHAHLKRYHTASARARQLLAWVQQNCLADRPVATSE